MSNRPRHFVYRILALHGFLLLAVLTLVILASAEIYQATRQDLVAQAASRQELLADQTCRGIENFYASIINNLDWIQGPPEAATAAPGQPAVPSANATLTTRLERFGANPLATQLVAEQLGDRISALFVYNKLSGEVTGYLPQKTTLDSKQLPPEMQTWLRGITATRVSRFMKLNGEGVSLVAAPFGILPPLPQGAGGRRGQLGRGYGGGGGGGGGGATRPARNATPQPPPGPRVLVAVVPGSEIESNFLPLLNDENNCSATLVDAQLQVITSSNPVLAGMNLASFDNPDLRDMVAAYQSNPKTMTRLFSEPLSVMGAQLGPRMVTLAPVPVAQDDWALLLAYPVANIDAQVRTLFNRAVVWAAFVALSITAILVSTAIQMIRFQAGLENVRHQVLTRELTQARRIQEQWLPQLASAPVDLDLAAINRPASHISGDFYNWFDLPDGRHAVVIGDVTGHGMAAAFLMSTTQLLVRNAMARIADPGTAMEEVNRQLGAQMFQGQFVTMLIITMDVQRHEMEVASAGHPPPLIVTDGIARKLPVEAQLVLGVEKEVSYPTQSFALPEMSSLLLYTDGVLDTRSPTGERFGAARLLAAVNRRAQTAAEMLQSASDAVEQFRAGEELDDDLTMVAIQLRKVIPRPAPRRPSLTA
jgi:hypothetical protein